MVYQRIWNGIEVKEVEITDEFCGYYIFIPMESYQKGFREVVINTYKTDFEEIEIVRVSEDLYHLRFYRISSAYMRSETPFLVLEMTGEEIENWRRNDVWFEKEYHYLVRTEGKKVYGPEGDRRCVKCRYLVGNNDTECKRCS